MKRRLLGPHTAAGTYAIDGFTITVRYDDGNVETHSLIAHPTDPGILWIGGAAYTRK